MSSEKVYGHDGPPQLQGRVEEVTAEVLEEWAAAGATWLRPRRARDPGEWIKRVRCRCGSRDEFQIRRAGGEDPRWVRGKYGGSQRCELICRACGSEWQLFDDGVHGYNAVVCDDRSHLPANYLESNQALLKPLVCDCGGAAFSVIAWAMYDCTDGIEEVPREQWDEAYGAFAAAAKCSGCGMVHEIAEAETA